MPVVKVREAIRRLEADGWYRLPSGSTSHRQLKHPTKAGRVTVPGHLSDDLRPGTWLSIQKKAGWR
jgi:predicted RNA binding protein YcfA (HicA-like mRNA interferase family)